MMEFLRKLFALLLNNHGATLNVMSVSGAELDEAVPEWWVNQHSLRGNTRKNLLSLKILGRPKRAARGKVK